MTLHHTADTQELAANERPTRPEVNDASGSLVGRVLAGRYRVNALLGAGATGLVFRGQSLDGIGDVAVKVLHPRIGMNAALEARFRLEAVATQRIDHPNVVRAVDIAVNEADGTTVFAMELLRGCSLGSILDRGHALGEGRSLDLAAQLCAGLSAAHAAGVVHRDVKPENVMIEPEVGEDGMPYERVRLFDFGIAQISPREDDPIDHTRLTLAGAIWGTPRYMAPEQARGKAVDARADVYACGVVLYEMLTGRAPFEADSPFEMLTQHVFDEPEAPSSRNPELDPRVDAVVLKALSKDPTDRQQSADELRDEILDVLARWSCPPAPAAPTAPWMDQAA